MMPQRANTSTQSAHRGPRAAMPSNHRPVWIGRVDGAWTLDVECLVPVSERILRPTTQRVRGEDAIVAYLDGRADSRPLVAGVRALFASATGDDNQSAGWEPREGQWRQTTGHARGAELAQSAVASGGGETSADAQGRIRVLMRRIAALEERREDVTHLTEMVRQLMNRVTELESRAASGTLQVPMASPLANGAPRGPVLSMDPASVPPAGIVPSMAPVPSMPPGVAAAAPAARAPNVVIQPVRNEKPSRAGKIQKLPSPRDISSSLSKLIGDKFTASVSRKSSTVFDATAGKHFLCMVVNDQQEVLGAIVGDLRSTVMLGGGLMLMPQGDMQEQLTTGEPNEDVISAYSEVFNTLSGLISQMSGNPHVRATFLEPFDAKAHGWMVSPHLRLDLDDSMGGRIAIMAR